MGKQKTRREKIEETKQGETCPRQEEGEIGIPMDGRMRENIKIGAEVDVLLKEDQSTPYHPGKPGATGQAPVPPRFAGATGQAGKLTHGIVAQILTSAATHPRGIKVRLEDGKVGRVQKIYAFPKINGREYIEGLT